MTRALVVAALALAACTRSATPNFYTLSSTATPDGLPPTALAVAVGPVSLPASVDRPQLVVRRGPNQVELQEFDRWAAPLDEAIARAVAGDLSVLLGTPRVAATPLAGFDPAYRVRIAIERFDAVPGEGVHVEALWVVEPAASRTPVAGRTAAQEPVQSPALAAVAAAQSRALAVVSADIAAAIRASARADGAQRREPPPARIR
jgi:uncharacterized lipoprotein YmbA